MHQASNTNPKTTETSSGVRFNPKIKTSDVPRGGLKLSFKGIAKPQIKNAGDTRLYILMETLNLSYQKQRPQANKLEP